ncbi:MAG: SpoIID/LytB domain-containing protein [Elusimicrobia bacterium]|nr:SpoIID/LytB domain-containing protein [Elusimicrobiota bacterium]
MGIDSHTIRVSIFQKQISLKLRTHSKVYALDPSGRKYMLLGNSNYEIKPGGGDIVLITRQALKLPVKLFSMDGDDRININGKAYKGDIYIKPDTDDRLAVVEEIPLEEYLYGVLPFEMSSSWPLEALKAQAVASRTFAIKNMSPSKEYDITSGIETQVYNGSAKLDAGVISAVNSTRGEILKYNGKIITAFFHACCGGRTTSVSSAWGEGLIKPLYGAGDPFCKNSPNYSWQAYIPKKELLSFIQKKGSTALKLKSVRILKKDRSGRAVSVRFVTDSGGHTVPARDFRRHFGEYGLKSTFIIRITPVKSGYQFAGRGWGHGVGMCQEGAKQMAINGRNYKRILNHYYPGAKIENIHAKERLQGDKVIR